MPIFCRKGPTLDGRFDRSASDAQWSIANSEVDGRPLIVRWEVQARRGCPDPSRPIKLTIGIQCADPKRNVLPSAEDLGVRGSVRRVGI